MNVIPEPAWEELLERLRALKGTALFLGRSDSGKSTLVRYLLEELTAAGRPVALVDADVGQSALGLPGSVSRRTFTHPPAAGALQWEHLSFLGAVSPARIITLLAAETGRMVLACRQEAPLTLVDTTGLVEGPLGRALKLAKIRAVAPDLVVGVSGGVELEPLLQTIPSAAVVRLTPSPLVLRRPPGQRFRYRHAKLAVHLQGAHELLLPARRFVFLHRGVPVHPLFTPPETGTVIGLNHLAETRALGVVTEAEGDSITVLTPLPSPRGIDRVILGDFSFEP